MLLGMSTVPFLDVFAKLLSEDYSVMQVTWTRFFFHACWLIPIILLQKVKWKRVPESIGLQFMSCLLYTSDAADDSLRVDLGGRRII